MLAPLNEHSFSNPRVHVINADAFVWLDRNGDSWDFVVVDFPDPTNYSLGKLYTTAFYRLLKKHVSENGLAVIQSTSPMFSRQSYWCIVRYAEAGGLSCLAVSRVCPEFRRVGFYACRKHLGAAGVLCPPGLRFLTVSRDS